MAETWEQRIRTAAEWLRERHAEAASFGPLFDIALCMQESPDYRVVIAGEVGSDNDIDRDLPVYALGRRAAQLVAALVAAAPALADLLEGEALDHAKHYDWDSDDDGCWTCWCDACDRSVTDVECPVVAAVKPIVEAIELVRGVTA